MYSGTGFLHCKRNHSISLVQELGSDDQFLHRVQNNTEIAQFTQCMKSEFEGVVLVLKEMAAPSEGDCSLLP